MQHAWRVFTALYALLLIVAANPAAAQLPPCTDNVYFGQHPGRVRVTVGGTFTLSLPVTVNGYVVSGSATWVHKKAGNAVSTQTAGYTYNENSPPSRTITPVAAHRGTDNLMRVDTTFTRQGASGQSVESGCEEDSFIVQDAPTANAGGPYTGLTYQNVQFVGAGTADPLYSDNLAPSFYWTFGDGANSSLQSPQHAYAAPGSYPVQLTVSDGFFTAVSNTTATISAPGGAFAFSNATYAIGEAGPSVMITITRTGGSQDSATVTVNSSNGTATAGPDYTGGPYYVNFTSGQTSQTFNVAIADDGIYEPNETFGLAISSVSGTGVYVGTPSSATVTIADDDPPPVPATPSITDVTGGVCYGTDVTWTASANASYYELQRKRNTGIWVLRYSGSATQFHDPNTQIGGTYTYKVRACNASGCSAFSGEFDIYYPQPCQL